MTLSEKTAHRQRLQSLYDAGRLVFLCVIQRPTLINWQAWVFVDRQYLAGWTWFMTVTGERP